MSDASFDQLYEVFDTHESFLLLSHVRPDGDAIGSQLALGASLEAMGKTVYLVNQDGLPSNLAFLKGSDKVQSPPADALSVDVVVALDTANHPRLGPDAIAAGGKPKLLLNIDHHKSNPGYGDLAHIDSSAPATGEILYHLIKSTGMPMPDITRDAIYVAVSTDTGSFQYSATTARTYEMAADLVRLGVDVGEINRLTYNSHPYRRIGLLRALLNTLEMKGGDRIAHWELPLSVKDELALLPEDSEDMIDHIRAIDGVIVALFFEELRDGSIRVSMRSKDKAIDACEVCQKFGGGGHALAAGIRMDMNLAEAKAAVVAEVERRVNSLG